ncbi:hypothetical protein [Novosphingobium sp. B-7]|uniref:hypothetical protein n=1 Tax=Novosphingobium sp. B-7 TaxID=1298855 RepID=UPI0011D2C2B8|nr:hypothetical protein [Novosphingobium sp. B-7]
MQPLIGFYQPWQHRLGHQIVAGCRPVTSACGDHGHPQPILGSIHHREHLPVGNDLDQRTPLVCIDAGMIGDGRRFELGGVICRCNNRHAHAKRPG